MPNDTPRTDVLYAKVWTFRNEDEATEACAAMRDLARELERENAKLREVLDTCRREHSEQAVAWGHPDHCDPENRDYHQKWATFCAQAINA